MSVSIYSTLISKVNWKAIRALQWNDLYNILFRYLQDDIEPEGKSKSGLYRFKKIAKQFNVIDGEIVLYTNKIPNELLGDDGVPLIPIDLPMRFKVVKPSDKEIIIGSCFSSVFSGGFKGVDSCYKKICQEYIGITRNNVSDFLKRTELKQLKRPTLTNELKPILMTRPLEMWQIDLVDFSKLGYEKFNSGFVFVINIIDHFSKFLWSFPLKNKSGALVAFTLQNLFMTEGSPSF